MLSASGCGIKYSVKGQVIDAKTGNPIEGAAVAIKWYKLNWNFIGIGANTTEIERAEAISDEEGYFKIPKRPFRKYDMGVYKKGYICWDSGKEVSFEDKPGCRVPHYYPGEIDSGIYSHDRIGHEVKSGMEAKLEPLKEVMTELQRHRHACFANDVARTCAPHGGSEFKKATKAEKELCYSKIRWK